MTEQEEKEITKLNNSRLLREAGRELLPLLNQMKAAVLARIIFSHQSAQPEQLPAHAAELSVIEELISRINRNDLALSRKEGEIR